MAALATTPGRRRPPKERSEVRRGHRGNGERLLRVEDEVSQERGLGDRERELAAEHDENRRAPEERAELGEPRLVAHARRRTGRAGTVEDRDERGRDERERARGGERMSPAPGQRDGRQRQRRGQPAQR